MRKFILSRKEGRKHLVVTEGIHDVVCYYAKKNDITIAEATHILLSKAVAREFGFSEKEIESIKKTQ